MVADQAGDGGPADLFGAEGLDEQGQRPGDPDRVGHLDLGPVGEPGGHDVLGHVPRRVGGGPVDLGRVLAGEGAAAVPGEPAVGVHDDLAAGQAGVADRAADDEAAGRVDVELLAQRRGVVESGRQHLGHDLLPQRVGQLGLHPVLVLGGDEHLLHPGRPAVRVVAHRHLGLAVRPQVRQQPLAPHLGEPAGQLVREHDRHRHQLGRLVARVAEHHALVARARGVERVGAAQVAGVVGLVHAAGDVGRLPVQRGDHADGVAVVAEVAGVVADVADHLAGDGGEVQHRLGGDLPGQHHKTGGEQGLDRHP